MLASLLVIALVTQADPSADKSAAERAAVAAEKAAEAAAKAAEAAQRIADRLAPAPAPAAPAAPATAPAAGAWAGTAGLGLSLLGGNTQTITLTANVALDRKWELWTLGIRATGAYGVTNPDTTLNSTTTAQTVARRAGATVRGDRSLGTIGGAFVLAGAEFDHVKSIESRSFGEAGASFKLFDEKEGDLERLFLRFDLALRGGYETRWIYFPASTPPKDYAIALLAPRVAGMFRWALNKNFRFSEDLEVLPFLLAPVSGRFLINSNTKVNARITDNVSLTLGFLLNIDTQPPAANLRSFDYALTAGAEAAF
ncbi:MAG: DUF481 domain-containing protein [Myxococcaceae bacterium]|jgi:hypothetical protein|nr:DUF481 domain-containing protein [Myxococcaceae bacterium]MCA3011341.1 DUF481 domain-containing protein [Myxococcaceae bacterium]